MASAGGLPGRGAGPARFHRAGTERPPLSAPTLLLATCRDLPDGDPDTALLASHLRRLGMDLQIAPWDDPTAPWPDAGATLIRSTWDYHLRREAFVAWARTVPRLFNPAALVEWNTDKRYLLELAPDLPTIPTRVLTDPSNASIATEMRACGWDQAVLKPAVGLDGHGVSRVSIDQLDEVRRRGAWILQPFVDEAATEGEVSVVLVEGSVTHAVLRTPPDHDFRAQERLGGRVRPADPPADVLELAEAAVGRIRPAPLYARVDVVRWHGQPVVLELELVEPSLFLSFSADAVSALTRGLTSRLAA